MISIPKNNYTQPTEVREHVVQAICEAFISGKAFSVFHPYSDGLYRNATRRVLLTNGKGYAFRDEPFGSDERTYKFNGAEMRAAFEELIKAGYHMWRVYEYDTWMGYELTRRPFNDRTRPKAIEVYSFDDFID